MGRTVGLRRRRNRRRSPWRTKWKQKDSRSHSLSARWWLPGRLAVRHPPTSVFGFSKSDLGNAGRKFPNLCFNTLTQWDEVWEKDGSKLNLRKSRWKVQKNVSMWKQLELIWNTPTVFFGNSDEQHYSVRWAGQLFEHNLHIFFNDWSKWVPAVTE